MDIKRIRIAVRNTSLWSKFDFMSYIYQEDFQVEALDGLKILKIFI